MFRDGMIFIGGLCVGVGFLFSLLRLPYWIHEHTRKAALKGRNDLEGRWLH